MRAIPLLLTALLILSSLSARAEDKWKLHPDAAEKPDVPHGKVTQMPKWESKIFPGTTRDWWIYVPAQYKADKPAAVMVFQDGGSYVSAKGNWRVPTVFDNFIASGDMPVTIGIFINPGDDPTKNSTKDGKRVASNRSFEYDSLGDRYAKFLLEEILPEVEKTHKLSHDPNERAICGASSGGICSFTVAWEHPEAFRKVLSTIGSFTNIRGGDAYPSLIRKTERKPIRIYQADTSGDLDNPIGNWPIANKQIHAALVSMGYDTRFDFAEGYKHSSEHGGSIFPDALKWLWRKETPKPVADTKIQIGGDRPLTQFLIEGEEWKMVADGMGFADGTCADAEGNLWFSDLKGSSPGIFRLAPDGTKTQVLTEPASGLKFGPDGRLYGCQNGKKQVVVFDLATKKMEVLAEDVRPNDLVVTHRGHIYFTETSKHQVTFLDPKTKKTHAADTGITAPNGISLSPDQGTLAVSDFGGENVWTFRIEADGSLTSKQPFMTMRKPIDPAGEFNRGEPPPYKKIANGDGMTTDSSGRYYVTTALGLQVFDSQGRLCGVLAKPQPEKPLTNCALAGQGLQYLFVTNGDKIFRRKVQAQAVLFFQKPH